MSAVMTPPAATIGPADAARPDPFPGGDARVMRPHDAGPLIAGVGRGRDGSLGAMRTVGGAAPSPPGGRLVGDDVRIPVAGAAPPYVDLGTAATPPAPEAPLRALRRAGEH